MSEVRGIDGKIINRERLYSKSKDTLNLKEATKDMKCSCLPCYGSCGRF